MQIVLHTFFEN